MAGDGRGTTILADVTDPAALADAVQWQRVIDIDLTGVFLSCQAQARVMLAH